MWDKDDYMIVGLLLLYIGMRNNYPLVYFVGCWFLILYSGLKIGVAFIKGIIDGLNGK